jgi:hypothetical protein
MDQRAPVIVESWVQGRMAQAVEYQQQLSITGYDYQLKRRSSAETMDA